MSSLQISTPDRAEAYFNGSLIGQVSSYLVDAIAELSARHDQPARRESGSSPAEQRKSEKQPQRGFFARFEARLWREEQERREAWLAESTDAFDLERRMRLLDRGRASA